MLKNEWKAIFKHKFFIIVILALALVPAIYNYIFLGSMWDPYGNLNKLPVAVVNLDKSSELNGQKLKLGDDVVAEMKKSKDLDYHFVSEKSAADGLKSGKYYMKITFPEQFSEQAASLMTNSPKSVQLDYQTTSGHNYISSKMSESAMNQLEAEVSKNITQNYTEAIFDNLSNLKTGMKSASDGSVKLADGSKTALTGSNELASNLSKLADSSVTFTNGADKLKIGVNQYLDGVKQAQTGASQLASGEQQFSNATVQLANGTQTLADKSKELKAGLTQFQTATSAAGQLQTASQTLLTGLSKLDTQTTMTSEQKTQISQLETGLNQLNQAIQAGSTDTKVVEAVQQDLTNVQSLLPTLIKDQVSATAAAVMQTPSFQALDTASQQQILAAIQGSVGTAPAVQADIATLTTDLTDVGTQLTALQNQMNQLAGSANLALPAASSTLANLSNGMEQVNSALSEQVVPGASKLNDGMAQFNTALENGTSQLNTGFDQFSTGLEQANSGAQQLAGKSKDLVTGSLQLNSGLNKLQANSPTLASGSSQLSDGAKQLSEGSAKLSDGGKSLSNGLTSLSEGSKTLSNSLTDASNQLSDTNSKKVNADSVAAPISVNHTDKDNVPVNGAGMTPYMIDVALFIGALATNVVIGIGFSGKEWKNGREFMWAKIGTNGVVAVLQAFIVCGAVALLGLAPSHWGLTLLSVLLISLAYMAINTFFLTWLGKVGEFLMIVLLVLQLATSAGTYPLQLAPKIFQQISPLLPMTYGLKMLRETIGLSGQIWPYILLFGLITIGFTYALSFFKKISRFA